MSDLSEKEVRALGYAFVRQLPDGKWIALHEFIFTWGLIYDIDQTSYQCRWCYDKEDWAEALLAFNNWDGVDKPPGPWIVEK